MLDPSILKYLNLTYFQLLRPLEYSEFAHSLSKPAGNSHPSLDGYRFKKNGRNGPVWNPGDRLVFTPRRNINYLFSCTTFAIFSLSCHYQNHVLLFCRCVAYTYLFAGNTNILLQVQRSRSARFQSPSTKAATFFEKP